MMMPLGGGAAVGQHQTFKAAIVGFPQRGVTYTVIVGNLLDEQTFTRIGYRMPQGISFPVNGLAEVCFDVFDGLACLGDFRHISIAGLGSAVVLQ